MKKLIIFIFSLICLSTSSTVFASSTVTSCTVDNTCKVYALDSLSSKNAIVGQEIHFKLCDSLTLSPTIQIPADSILTGKILKVEKGSGWGCPGKLSIHIKFDDTIPFQGELNLHGTPPNFFIQFSLFGGFIKGENAEIIAGNIHSLKIIPINDTNTHK
jgi:hypothetical protein